MTGTTKALGKALLRSEASVRKAAAKALGQLKDTAGIEPLAEAIKVTKDSSERDLFDKTAISIIEWFPFPSQ